MLSKRISVQNNTQSKQVCLGCAMIMANKKVEYKYVDNRMQIGNETLEWVHVYKYLGIELHSDGKFSKSSENLCIRG